MPFGSGWSTGGYAVPDTSVEGEYRVTVLGVDNVGNSRTGSITYTVGGPPDAVPPQARILYPEPGQEIIRYTEFGEVRAECPDQREGGSGIKECRITIDGQATSDVRNLPAGPHTVRVQATDNAGNTTVNTVDFRMVGWCQDYWCYPQDESGPAVTFQPSVANLPNWEVPVGFDLRVAVTCTDPTGQQLATGIRDCAGKVESSRGGDPVLVELAVADDPDRPGARMASGSYEVDTTVEQRLTLTVTATDKAALSDGVKDEESGVMTYRDDHTTTRTLTIEVTAATDGTAPDVRFGGDADGLTVPVGSQGVLRPAWSCSDPEVDGEWTSGMRSCTATISRVDGSGEPAAFGSGSYAWGQGTPDTSLEGEYRIVVLGVDNAGNSGTGSNTFTIGGPPDTVAPEVNILYPTVGQEIIRYTEFNTVRAECPDQREGGSGIKECLVTVDGRAARTVHDLPAGPHTVRVQATDNAGNTTTASTEFQIVGWCPSDSYCFPQDKDNPEIIFKAGDANLSNPVVPVGSALDVAIECIDPASGNDLATGIQTCSGQVESSLAEDPLPLELAVSDDPSRAGAPKATGTYHVDTSVAQSLTLTVRATDNAALSEWGRDDDGIFQFGRDHASTKTLTITVTGAPDDTAPDVVFRGDVDGLTVPVGSRGVLQPSWSCSDPEVDGDWTSGMASCAATVSRADGTGEALPFGTAWPTAGYGYADASVEGEYRIDVVAVDNSGNSRTQSISYTIGGPPDTVPPQVRIPYPEPGQDIIRYTGLGYVHPECIDERQGGSGLKECGTTIDGRAATELKDLPVGPHTLRVQATDNAGNATVETAEFQIVGWCVPEWYCNPQDDMRPEVQFQASLANLPSWVVPVGYDLSVAIECTDPTSYSYVATGIRKCTGQVDSSAGGVPVQVPLTIADDPDRPGATKATGTYHVDTSVDQTLTLTVTATDRAAASEYGRDDDGKMWFGTDRTTSRTLTITVGDGDTVSSSVENGAPNGGDGNGDGVPDAQQDNVASLPVGGAQTGEPDSYLTVVAAGEGAELTDVHTIDPTDTSKVPDPLPWQGVTLPEGLVSFVLNKVEEGSDQTISIYTSSTADLTGYAKYNPDAADPDEVWTLLPADRFHIVDDHRVDIRLTDGGVGDADGVANGSIDDPGGFTSRSVVLDETGPTVNVTGVQDGKSYTLGDVPTPACTATDDGSGLSGDCTDNLSGGNANGVGEFTYEATATDNAGNRTTTLVKYKVVYRVDYLQPINDPNVVQGIAMSVFKSGSTVPVKLQLKRSDGTLITPLSAPSWVVPVRGTRMSAATNESVFTEPPSSEPLFEVAGDHWRYNWKTKGLAGDYTYRIGARLDDGITHWVEVALG